jgi:hypothetical protein
VYFWRKASQYGNSCYPRTAERWGKFPVSDPVAPTPTSSSRQYQFERSPRSRPIVILGSEKFLICFAAALTFFVAGLLYLLRFERVDHSGA